MPHRCLRRMESKTPEGIGLFTALENCIVWTNNAGRASVEPWIDAGIEAWPENVWPGGSNETARILVAHGRVVDGRRGGGASRSCGCADCCARGGIALAAAGGAHHRSLCSWRRNGRGGPHPRSGSFEIRGLPDRHREQGRRQHQYRHRGSRPCRARRLHGAVLLAPVCDQPLPVLDARLGFLHRFRPGDAARDLPRPDGRPEYLAGEIGHRVHRLCEGERRQDDVLLLGHRHLNASRRRAIQAPRRHRDDPHPLPRRRAGGDRRHRRAHRRSLQHFRQHALARSRRPAARPCRHLGAALLRRARLADGGRSGPPGLRRHCLVRTLCPGGDAGRDRAQAQCRRGRRARRAGPSATRWSNSASRSSARAPGSLPSISKPRPSCGAPSSRPRTSGANEPVVIAGARLRSRNPGRGAFGHASFATSRVHFCKSFRFVREIAREAASCREARLFRRIRCC